MSIVQRVGMMKITSHIEQEEDLKLCSTNRNDSSALFSNTKESATIDDHTWHLGPVCTLAIQVSLCLSPRFGVWI